MSVSDERGKILNFFIPLNFVQSCHDFSPIVSGSLDNKTSGLVIFLDQPVFKEDSFSFNMFISLYEFPHPYVEDSMWRL